MIFIDREFKKLGLKFVTSQYSNGATKRISDKRGFEICTIKDDYDQIGADFIMANKKLEIADRFVELGAKIKIDKKGIMMISFPKQEEKIIYCFEQEFFPTFVEKRLEGIFKKSWLIISKVTINKVK